MATLRKFEDKELSEILAQGKSQTEAAAALGVTEGAISLRLKKMREQVPVQAIEDGMAPHLEKYAAAKAELKRIQAREKEIDAQLVQMRAEMDDAITAAARGEGDVKELGLMRATIDSQVGVLEAVKSMIPQARQNVQDTRKKAEAVLAGREWRQAAEGLLEALAVAMGDALDVYTAGKQTLEDTFDKYRRQIESSMLIPAIDPPGKFNMGRRVQDPPLDAVRGWLASRIFDRKPKPAPKPVDPLAGLPSISGGLLMAGVDTLTAIRFDADHPPRCDSCKRRGHPGVMRKVGTIFREGTLWTYLCDRCARETYRFEPRDTSDERTEFILSNGRPMATGDAVPRQWGRGVRI